MREAHIISEINKTLHNFSEEKLQEVLLYLHSLEKEETKPLNMDHLNDILIEDKDLLHKLAQ